jgi:hypothetical protein
MTSGDNPRLLLALTPIAERAIERLLFGAEAPVELVGSAAEADELDRLADTTDAAAALVSPQLPGISAGHCARLRATGLRIVGLARDDEERQQLAHLGADAVIGADASPERLVAAVRGGADADGPRRGALDPEGQRHNAGRAVLAVVGSKGAAGATECAASLAALASDRWPVLLTELDAFGGDLDVRVAADPDEGSTLALVRALHANRSGELDDLLARWTVAARGWPTVLLGPAPTTSASAELARPGAVAHALDAVASRWPAVVCDVGFTLSEQHDAAARIHREALVHADAVLLVIGAREAQLRHGLVQLDALLDDLAIGRERLRVAVNGLGAPGAPDRATVEQTVAAALAERRLAADAWLDWDARGLRRAQRLALPLARAHPRGTYARVLGRLLDTLFVPVAESITTERKQPLTAAAEQLDLARAEEPV